MPWIERPAWLLPLQAERGGAGEFCYRGGAMPGYGGSAVQSTRRHTNAAIRREAYGKGVGHTYLRARNREASPWRACGRAVGLCSDEKSTGHRMIPTSEKVANTHWWQCRPPRTRAESRGTDGSASVRADDGALLPVCFGEREATTLFPRPLRWIDKEVRPGFILPRGGGRFAQAPGRVVEPARFPRILLLAASPSAR
jgi:hypothetical protein